MIITLLGRRRGFSTQGSIYLCFTTAVSVASNNRQSKFFTPFLDFAKKIQGRRKVLPEQDCLPNSVREKEIRKKTRVLETHPHVSHWFKPCDAKIQWDSKEVSTLLEITSCITILSSRDEREEKKLPSTHLFLCLSVSRGAPNQTVDIGEKTVHSHISLST